MRIDYVKLVPRAYAAMREFDSYARTSGVDRSLLELIKIRASQINGCTYCLEMHTREAREQGEKQWRLDTLSAWRETPFFDNRERAALAWTERVTLIADEHVPDEVYNDMCRHFTEEEIVKITLAVIAINGWNRLAISFGTDVSQREA
jgi:AhpD family alkylhydroperoxidase